MATRDEQPGRSPGACEGASSADGGPGWSSVLSCQAAVPVCSQGLCLSLLCVFHFANKLRSPRCVLCCDSVNMALFVMATAVTFSAKRNKVKCRGCGEGEGGTQLGPQAPGESAFARNSSPARTVASRNSPCGHRGKAVCRLPLTVLSRARDQAHLKPRSQLSLWAVCIPGEGPGDFCLISCPCPLLCPWLLQGRAAHCRGVWFMSVERHCLSHGRGERASCSQPIPQKDSVPAEPCQGSSPAPRPSVAITLKCLGRLTGPDQPLCPSPVSLRQPPCTLAC